MNPRTGPPWLLAAGIILLMSPIAATADEGMWLFNNPPRKLLKEKYGFDATPQWLEHVQKSSVRFNSGGSGSFVSANGLVMTNHHVGADCLQKLSTPQKNYYQDGFFARSLAEEARCPDLELNVLMSIEDVTDRVGAAVKESLARSKHLASVGLFVSDTSRGRVLSVPGARGYPLVTYSLNRYDAARLVRGIAIAAEVFLEAGAEAVYPGLRGADPIASGRGLEQLRQGGWGPAALSPTGFHPMGTCRMGRDSASTVVDPYGRLHGMRNLFVADASVFPSCVGVNPQMTIMALATRTTRHILERAERYLA